MVKMTRLTDTIEKGFGGRRKKVLGGDDASRAREGEGPHRFTQNDRLRQGRLNHRCSRLPPIQRSGTSQVAADTKPISYSIVIPVFNEEAVLPVLLRRLDLLLARLHGPAEAIFVDDSSSASGPFVLQALAQRHPRFRHVGLSRHFDQQGALTAGMDAAPGQA